MGSTAFYRLEADRFWRRCSLRSSQSQQIARKAGSSSAKKYEVESIVETKGQGLKNSTLASCQALRESFLLRPKEFLRWIRLWKTRPVWPWVRAAENFKSKDFLQAAKLYRLGIERFPNHPAVNSAKLDLAYCLYRNNEYQSALEILQELLKGEENPKDVYLLAARIQMYTGCALSASTTMHSCLLKFPGDIQTLSCYMHSALYSCAGLEAQQLIRSELLRLKRELTLDDSRNLHLDTALAHFEIVRGEIRKGERMLARVLATGEAPFEAVLLRGERLLERGRVLPAREQLTRAMNASPRDPRPVLLLARSYLRNGTEANPTWARQLAEVACKLSCWQNAECLNVLARAYEASNEKANAQLFYERMKTLPSMDELGVTYYQSSLEQLRAQKVS